MVCLPLPCCSRRWATGTVQIGVHVMLPMNTHRFRPPCPRRTTGSGVVRPPVAPPRARTLRSFRSPPALSPFRVPGASPGLEGGTSAPRLSGVWGPRRRAPGSPPPTPGPRGPQTPSACAPPARLALAAPTQHASLVSPCETPGPERQGRAPRPRCMVYGTSGSRTSG